MFVGKTSPEVTIDPGRCSRTFAVKGLRFIASIISTISGDFQMRYLQHICLPRFDSLAPFQIPAVSVYPGCFSPEITGSLRLHLHNVILPQAKLLRLFFQGFFFLRSRGEAGFAAADKIHVEPSQEF